MFLNLINDIELGPKPFENIYNYVFIKTENEILKLKITYDHMDIVDAIEEYVKKSDTYDFSVMNVEEIKKAYNIVPKFFPYLGKFKLEDGFRKTSNYYVPKKTSMLDLLIRLYNNSYNFLEFDEFDRLYYFYYSYLTMGVKNIIDMQTIENLFSKFKIRIVDRISNIELEKLLKSSNCRFEKHHIDSLNQMKWILKTSEENTVKCNVLKLDNKIEKISNKEELNTKHI